MQSDVKGMTVFNTEDVDTKKQPMFFGKPLGVQRYDNFKYPAFENLTKSAVGIFLETRRSFLTERSWRLSDFKFSTKTYLYF